jgi:hypothetical protein
MIIHLFDGLKKDFSLLPCDYHILPERTPTEQEQWHYFADNHKLPGQCAWIVLCDVNMQYVQEHKAIWQADECYTDP